MRLALVAETDKTDWNDEALVGEIIRLSGIILGLVLGVMTGLFVFVATNWLVLKEGEQVGPHLALLGQFFLGYSVSFPGSLIGLAYGTALGFVAGWSIGWLYNLVALRSR